MPELSIIISYYKGEDNLEIIFDALNRQSFKNFEVIVSEDDANESTFELVNIWRKKVFFEIKHIFQQEDNGFRKNHMLNRAIKNAKSNKIAFIDGDCIPREHFAKEYQKHIDPDHFLSGRAVMLDETLTKNALAKKTITEISLKDIYQSKSERKKEAIYSPSLRKLSKIRGLVGRNWGAHKESLIAINGFDNEYIKAGYGEDVDIEWRLLRSGTKAKNMKNAAIVYHMWHPRSYSNDGVQFNKKLMKEKQLKDQFVCLDGYNQVEK